VRPLPVGSVATDPVATTAQEVRSLMPVDLADILRQAEVWGQHDEIVVDPGDLALRPRTASWLLGMT
jgi:hypothetical protein